MTSDVLSAVALNFFGTQIYEIDRYRHSLIYVQNRQRNKSFTLHYHYRVIVILVLWHHSAERLSIVSISFVSLPLQINALRKL